MLFFSLNIREFQTGPGKLFIAVLESLGFFVSKRVGTLEIVVENVH